MSKLMGLDYVIQFRKGKENVVADALSRCHEEGMAAAISTMVPNRLQEIIDSYHKDGWAKDLLE